MFTFLQSRSPFGKTTDFKRHIEKGKKKKIYPSICLSASLYVSFLPLSNAPVDPLAFPFLQFSPTPVFIPSFIQLPLSSPICH